jgi:cell division protein FtsL
MTKSKSTKLNIFEIKKINILLIITVLLSLFTYVYSYQLSVSYASSIETFEDKISNIKSKISESEVQIVENKREINKNIAFEKGFVEIENVVFVKRSSATALNAIRN